jgi:hypothetical protein
MKTYIQMARWAKGLYQLSVFLVCLFLFTACEKPEIKGYYFSQNIPNQQPYIYAGVRNGPGSHKISIALPCVTPKLDAIESEPQMFFAEQTNLDQKCELVVTMGESIWDVTDEKTIRPDVKKAYENFEIELEKAGLSPDAIRTVKEGIAASMPMTFDEVLYYYYGFSPEKSYIDLLPGMRLRVDYQIYQQIYSSGGETLNGFVGNGTSYYEVVSYRHRAQPARNLLGLEPFLVSMDNPENVGSVKGGAGGVIDLHQPGFRKPYYRLFYPTEIPASDSPGWVGTDQNVTLIAADTLSALAEATDDYLSNQTTETGAAVFHFRGRATVIPEIAVLVNGRPVYVSVGTTVGQLLDRYTLTSRPKNEQALPRLQFTRNHGQTVRFGPKSTVFPIHLKVFILDRNPADPIAFTRYWNGSDAFSLPLVKGDRMAF